MVSEVISIQVKQYDWINVFHVFIVILQVGLVIFFHIFSFVLIFPIVLFKVTLFIVLSVIETWE